MQANGKHNQECTCNVFMISVPLILINKEGLIATGMTDSLTYWIDKAKIFVAKRWHLHFYSWKLSSKARCLVICIKKSISVQQSNSLIWVYLARYTFPIAQCFWYVQRPNIMLYVYRFEFSPIYYDTICCLSYLPSPLQPSTSNVKTSRNTIVKHIRNIFTSILLQLFVKFTLPPSSPL